MKGEEFTIKNAYKIEQKLIIYPSYRVNIITRFNQYSTQVFRRNVACEEF